MTKDEPLVELTKDLIKLGQKRPELVKGMVIGALGVIALIGLFFEEKK